MTPSGSPLVPSAASGYAGVRIDGAEEIQMPADESDRNSAEASVRVGERAPDFSVRCVDATSVEPRRTQLGDYVGRWLMLLFYPRDFSFVCPTELTAFSARRADFDRRNCDLLGVSVDTI